jgi:DNA repair protein SbcC/Rad50
MRIRKIELQNLNSLRGQHKVDFTAPPLDTAGIIAVTGETGAGKSTLLDAILLALYAETARKHQKEVVTYGQKEAWAEVEFEVSGQIYRSRWEVKLKKGGDQNTAQMSLTKLVGDHWEGIGSGIHDLTSKTNRIGLIETLVGLSYDQFCKSVILPQGKFAEFFTAKEDDRAAILERLTNTEIYSHIGIAAHERLAEAKQALDVLELKRGEMRIPTKQEIADWKAQDKETQEQIKAVKAERNALEQVTKWYADEGAYQTTLAGYRERLTHTEAEQLAFAPQLLKLRNFERARPFLERYRTAAAQMTELAAEKAQLEALKAQLLAENESIALHQSDLERLKAQSESQIEAKKALQPVLEKVQSLDENIRQKEQILVPQLEDVRNLETAGKSLITDLEKETQKLAELEPLLLKVRSWIADNAALNSIEEDYGALQKQLEQIAEMEREAEVLTARIAELEVVRNAAAPKEQQLKAQQQAASAQIAEIQTAQQAALAHLSTTKDGLTSQIEELQKLEFAYQKVQEQQKRYRGTLREISLLRESNEHLLLEQEKVYRDLLSFVLLQDELEQEKKTRDGILDLHRRLLFIAEERAQLKPDQPCPVCGSLEHPDAAHLVEQVALASQDSEKVERKLESVKADVQRLQNEARLIHTKLGEVLEDSEEAANAELRSLFQRSSDEELELKAMIGKLPKAKKAQTDHLSVVTTDTALLEIQTELDQFQQLRKQLESDQKALDKLQTEQRAAENALAAHLQSTQATNTEWEQKQTQLAANTTKTEAERNQMRSKLAVYQIDYQQVGVQILVELNKSREHWKKAHDTLAEREKAQIEADANKISLTTQMEQLTEQLQTKTALVDGYKQEHAALTAQRKQLVGETEPATQLVQIEQQIQATQLDIAQAQEEQLERNKKAALLQGQCTKMEADCLKMQATNQAGLASLGADMLKAGFDLESLPNFELTPEEAESIEKTAETLNQTQHTLKIQLTETEAKLTQHLTTAPELAKVDLESEQLRLQSTESTLFETQGILRQRFEDVKNLNVQSTALQEQIEKAQAECARWARIDDVIGSRDGAKFRKYAQGITLDNLIYHANTHLKRLFGRYQIARIVTNARTELQMEIVDTFQSDHRRTINTLSGGETFLISLAMALGLSDLAGQKTRIQSVFIDEGFGSLDPNTLDTAMEALENLQAEGVTVGIISHLPALHERIGTRVMVRKVGSGYSTIEVS